MTSIRPWIRLAAATATCPSCALERVVVATANAHGTLGSKMPTWMSHFTAAVLRAARHCCCAVWGVAAANLLSKFHSPPELFIHAMCASL